MNPDGKMRLAAYFNPTGHHVASWRHPRAQADAHINIKHYVEIAQTAERAKFDLIFLADGVATRQADIEARALRAGVDLYPVRTDDDLVRSLMRISELRRRRRR